LFHIEKDKSSSPKSQAAIDKKPSQLEILAKAY